MNKLIILDIFVMLGSLFDSARILSNCIAYVNISGVYTVHNYISVVSNTHSLFDWIEFTSPKISVHKPLSSLFILDKTLLSNWNNKMRSRIDCVNVEDLIV